MVIDLSSLDNLMTITEQSINSLALLGSGVSLSVWLASRTFSCCTSSSQSHNTWSTFNDFAPNQVLGACRRWLIQSTRLCNSRNCSCIPQTTVAFCFCPITRLKPPPIARCRSSGRKNMIVKPTFDGLRKNQSLTT